MKKRFCMTLDGDLMQKLETYIDGAKFNNRSRAVEFFLQLGLTNYRPERTAMILCGGLGTRLRPLTYILPKPMLPVGHRPLLEFQIGYLKKYEFDRIILAVGYLQEQIVRYFAYGEKFGVKIIYSSEKEPLDTGGAIKNAEKLITSDFLVMNSDVVFDALNLQKLLSFHKDNKAVATVVVTKMQDPSRFGVVELDERDRIVKFIEKPKGALKGSRWINAGVYALSPKILSHIRRDKRASIEKNVFPRLAAQGKILGFKYEGYWSDVGTQEDYMRVSRDVITGRLKA